MATAGVGPTDGPPGAVCIICLDRGDERRPLQLCKGTTPGFAHSSCLHFFRVQSTAEFPVREPEREPEPESPEEPSEEGVPPEGAGTTELAVRADHLHASARAAADALADAEAEVEAVREALARVQRRLCAAESGLAAAAEQAAGSRAAADSAAQRAARCVAADAAACAALAPAPSLGDDGFPDEVAALVCSWLSVPSLGRLACAAKVFSERTLTDPESGESLSSVEEGARLAVLRHPNTSQTKVPIDGSWLRRLWRLEQASSAKAAPTPEVVYKCRLASAPSRIGARRRTGARGRPVLLTVSANRVLLSDTIAGSSRAEELCSYRLPEIVSWAVANDRFAFHVHGPFNRRSRADVATKETVELVTKQAREISVQLKGHVDALVLLRRCFDAIRLGAKAAKTAQTLRSLGETVRGLQGKKGSKYGRAG